MQTHSKEREFVREYEHKCAQNIKTFFDCYSTVLWLIIQVYDVDCRLESLLTETNSHNGFKTESLTFVEFTRRPKELRIVTENILQR